MNRKMLGKIIIPITFTIGMLIFFYPIIGNWLSTKDHYTVISKHNEVLAQMSEAEKELEREKAKQYNESLTETAIPIIDPFSEDQETGESATETNTSYYNVLDIGETMGHIEIPSINVNLPIYHGISDDVLSQGIGHMSNSSFPVGGLGTHTALTGHRGLPSSKLFRDLDKVEVDDVFYIHTLEETLAYKVDDIQIVLPSETNWLEMKEDKDYVTLITCEPYMINTHRLLVRGERVPYDPLVKADVASKGKDNIQLIEQALFIGGIVIITLFMLLYFLRRNKKKGWEQ